MNENENITADDKSPLTVPYIVWESDRARSERVISRLIGVIVLLIICLVGSNAFWVYEWTQYDYVSETFTETIDQDTQGSGINNYIGQDGDIVNGTTENNESDQENDQDTQGQ